MYTCHWKSGGEGIFAGIQKTLAQVKRLETFTKTLVMYHSIAKTNQKIKSATTGKKQRIQKDLPRHHLRNHWFPGASNEQWEKQKAHK